MYWAKCINSIFNTPISQGWARREKIKVIIFSDIWIKSSLLLRTDSKWNTRYNLSCVNSHLLSCENSNSQQRIKETKWKNKNRVIMMYCSNILQRGFIGFKIWIQKINKNCLTYIRLRLLFSYLLQFSFVGLQLCRVVVSSCIAHDSP